jgi:hypothetical protein
MEACLKFLSTREWVSVQKSYFVVEELFWATQKKLQIRMFVLVGKEWKK